MGSDHMPALCEGPHVLVRKESRHTDPGSRDEELPAPAVTFERLGGEQRRAAAVVKRQQHLWWRSVRLERSDL